MTSRTHYRDTETQRRENSVLQQLCSSRSWLALCLCVFVVSPAFAAPPTLTSLHPAGAQRGTAVEVAATGALDGAPVWASGTGVAVENAKGKLKVAVAKDAMPGLYWLRAHNADGASGPRPFVVGTLPEVLEKEPNDDIKKAHLLDGSSYVVNGKLEKSGDVDCFAIKLKKGQTLVASLEAHHTLRSPMDAVIQIVSADGFVLDENNDWRGLDPQIAYEAKKDGIYIARVYAFPAQPDSSIRHFGSDACVYRLTLTAGPFADFAMPPAVRADGPKRPEFDSRGWNLAPESRPLVVSAPPTEPFATAFGEDVAGTIRLRREPHPVYTQADGALKPPFSFGGILDAPKKEVPIALEGKKGQTLTFQVESRAFGLAVNPVLRVLDKDGKQLTRAEPGKLNADTSQLFVLPADGAYTAAVSDLYGGGGPRHAFLLRVLSEPDYELSVAADRFAAEPGKPAVVAVTVNRFRGFAKAVEVTAEGLPDSVKVEVVQPAKPSPSVVTLSISSNQPVSGAFRLVGRVKDEPNSTRVARAPLVEFETTTADLWFTSTAGR